MTFTTSNVLVAYFETHDVKASLSSRDELQPTDPYQLHAIFLDPDHGEILSEGVWPVRPSNPAYFFAARDDKFVVGDGEALSLYSPDRSLIKILNVPWLHEGPFSTWSAQISPDGVTLLAQHNVGQNGAREVQLDLFDVGQMSLLKTWRKTTYRAWALWGQELAWSTDHEVYLESTESEPKLLAYSQGGFCGPPSFINEGGVVVVCGSTLIILTANGTIIRQFALGAVGVASPTATPSRNGTTFAVPTFVPGLFDTPTARKMTVKVFNIGKAKPVLTVDIPPRLGWGGIAISPRGDLLAVGTGQFIKVYRIPRLNSHDTRAGRQ
ncbi:MAG: hypothetical protein ACRD5M_16710 [Candidatus Acidiferrales bacterium]